MNVQLAAKSALEYYNSGNLEKSEQLCKKILKRQDKNHYILNLLGLICLKRKDYDSAISYFKKSISINPSYTEGHCNLGLVLMKKGDLDTAMTHFKKASEINPLMSEAWGNMGSALYQKGLIEDALEYYKKALKLNPTLAEHWLNIGTCLIDIGRPREAIQYLQKAIEIKPDYPLAHFNLSFARLLLGDFKRGWFEYMWRWGLEEFQIPQFSQPLWDGSYLDGKTIYIHREQGFGDSIQFIRYIPLVAERGGRVIVAVQKVLLQLIKSVEGISELITEGDPLPQFDVHCPLAGLPLAFQTNLETIPSKVPYLSVDSGLIKKWGEKLHSDKGILKVGLAWAGSQFHKKDLFRSINLEQFAPLAEISDIVFYSLQKGRGSEQAKNPPKGMKLIDLMDEVQDFSDTAAIIENLDLVISVDTAVAHLAGALGKPVWTLLPFAPDWRWMLGRKDSPWYPTMRLFRQPALRDWDSVIRRVADELRELSKGKTINITQEEKVEKELSTDTSSEITSEGDQIQMEKETKGVGREDIAIILQCEGMGDCLFAMAVIKKLYIMDGMNSRFILFTHNPHLFQKCPYVEKVYHIHNMAERSKYKKAIILFDTTKLAHWTVDTFNFISIPLGIGELSFREKQLEYFPVEEDKSQHFDVVINTSITWPSRSWPIENWQKVADYILEKGYSVAVVGKDTFSKADNMWKRSYGLKGCVDLTNKLSLDQTYYTIKNSKLFITCQNGLSVLSGATDTEIIVLDMSIEWSKRAIYRNEDPHYKVTYVKGNCQIYCCSSFECPIYGEFRCIPTVEQVLEAVERKLHLLIKNKKEIMSETKKSITNNNIIEEVKINGKTFYKYRNKLYPDYLNKGNAVSFILKRAKLYCNGKGIDVGAGNYPFPNAIPIQDEPFQNAYILDKFENNSLDYVFSSHCLEHLERWEEALRLWISKLKPGGILFLYLPHQSMELWHPGGPWVGTQHKWIPTANVINDFLKKNGMIIIEYNPDKDDYWSFHIVALKLDHSVENNNVRAILIQRQGALGDVLLITPFLPVLKAKYPHAEIHIRTDATEVLLNNPYVDCIIPFSAQLNLDTYNLVVNLDLSYEREPLNHIIDVYKKYLNVLPLSEKPLIFPSTHDEQFSDELIKKIGKFAIFDIGRTWPSRSWPISYYKSLAELFNRLGIKIIELGITDQATGRAYNLTNKTTIHQAAALIRNSLFFVGPDSLLGHIAQSFEVPTFLFFGPVLPETRIWRDCHCVKPLFNKELSCLGCHQRLPAPVTYSTCQRGDNYCMNSIKPNMVFEEIMKVIQF